MNKLMYLWTMLGYTLLTVTWTYMLGAIAYYGIPALFS